MPRPTKSDPRIDSRGYRKQAEDVLKESAALDDEKKMLSEFFDNKLPSLGGSVGARLKGGVLDFIAAEFLVSERQKQHHCTSLAHLLAGKRSLEVDCLLAVVLLG